MDLKDDMDPTFRMQKQRYEYTKAYAEMMYEADPKWQQAKYQLEIGDCEAEFSRYTDPKFQKAHTDYRYYKDFGLD